MADALTSAEWLELEEEIDAFSVVVKKDYTRPKKFYQLLFSDSYFIYDAYEFDTVLEVWQVLDEDGAMNL